MELVNPFAAGDDTSGQVPRIPGSREIAQKIWSDPLTIVKWGLSNHTYTAWFVPIQPVQFEEKKLLLQIPSQFFYDWIEEHHYSLLVEALTQVTGVEVTIEYAIKAEERALY